MEDIKEERYKSVCIECGKVFYACKSIAQDMGLLSNGHGTCPKCGTFLNLTFNEKTKEMNTLKWDDYIKQNKK